MVPTRIVVNHISNIAKDLVQLSLHLGKLKVQICLNN